MKYIYFLSIVCIITSISFFSHFVFAVDEASDILDADQLDIEQFSLEQENIFEDNTTRGNPSNRIRERIRGVKEKIYKKIKDSAVRAKESSQSEETPEDKPENTPEKASAEKDAKPSNQNDTKEGALNIVDPTEPNLPNEPLAKTSDTIADSDSTPHSTVVRTPHIVWLDTFAQYSQEDFANKDTHLIWYTDPDLGGKVQSWQLYIALVSSASALDWENKQVSASAISNITLLHAQENIALQTTDTTVFIPADILLHSISLQHNESSSKTTKSTPTLTTPSLEIKKDMQIGSFVLKAGEAHDKVLAYFVRAYFLSNTQEERFIDSKLLVVHPQYARYSQMKLVK